MILMEDNIKSIDDQITDYIRDTLFRLQKKYQCLGYAGKEKNKIERFDKTREFIPQLWWGDIENEKVKVLILGKNPSLCVKADGTIDDLSDNIECKDALNVNLQFSNREDRIKNLPLDTSNSYFSKWWLESFEGIKIEQMNGIAIYNLFGFYSKYYPDKLDAKESHVYKIDGLKEHILSQFKTAQYIFLLWKSSWKDWRIVLDFDKNAKDFQDKKIYVVNEKSQVNHKLINATPIPIEQLEKMYNEDQINKIQDDIKTIFERNEE